MGISERVSGRVFELPSFLLMGICAVRGTGMNAFFVQFQLALALINVNKWFRRKQRCVIFLITDHFLSLNFTSKVKVKFNKKDRWDSGKTRCQQIHFCDIQIKVVISRRQIYEYHTDLLPLKI